MSKGTIFEHALSRISDSVYQQLTGFGRNLINILPEANETGFERITPIEKDKKYDGKSD